jgi:hypothetical protein
MIGKKKVLPVILAAALCLGGAAPVFPAPSQEYRIKAAFLYNFAQFVEWPSKDSKKDAPFVIGVLGRDPFGDEIDSLQNEMLHGRRIVVKRYQTVDQLNPSNDLIFISPSEQSELDQILDKLAGTDVLTVGDGAGFADKGGVIGFITKENKVRFVVNQKSAEQKGLHVNSQLLSLAERVIS